jgi:hypothetical protein
MMILKKGRLAIDHFKDRCKDALAWWTKPVSSGYFYYKCVYLIFYKIKFIHPATSLGVIN